MKSNSPSGDHKKWNTKIRGILLKVQMPLSSLCVDEQLQGREYFARQLVCVLRGQDPIILPPYVSEPFNELQVLLRPYASISEESALQKVIRQYQKKAHMPDVSHRVLFYKCLHGALLKRPKTSTITTNEKESRSVFSEFLSTVKEKFWNSPRNADTFQQLLHRVFDKEDHCLKELLGMLQRERPMVEVCDELMKFVERGGITWRTYPPVEVLFLFNYILIGTPPTSSDRIIDCFQTMSQLLIDVTDPHMPHTTKVYCQRMCDAISAAESDASSKSDFNWYRKRFLNTKSTNVDSAFAPFHLCLFLVVERAIQNETNVLMIHNAVVKTQGELASLMLSEWLLILSNLHFEFTDAHKAVAIIKKLTHFTLQPQIVQFLFELMSDHLHVDMVGALLEICGERTKLDEFARLCGHKFQKVLSLSMLARTIQYGFATDIPYVSQDVSDALNKIKILKMDHLIFCAQQTTISFFRLKKHFIHLVTTKKCTVKQAIQFWKSLLHGESSYPPSSHEFMQHLLTCSESHGMNVLDVFCSMIQETIFTEKFVCELNANSFQGYPLEKLERDLKRITEAEEYYPVPFSDVFIKFARCIAEGIVKQTSNRRQVLQIAEIVPLIGCRSIFSSWLAVFCLNHLLPISLSDLTMSPIALHNILKAEQLAKISMNGELLDLIATLKSDLDEIFLSVSDERTSLRKMEKMKECWKALCIHFPHQTTDLPIDALIAAWRREERSVRNLKFVCQFMGHFHCKRELREFCEQVQQFQISSENCSRVDLRVFVNKSERKLCLSRDHVDMILSFRTVGGKETPNAVFEAIACSHEHATSGRELNFKEMEEILNSCSNYFAAVFSGQSLNLSQLERIARQFKQLAVGLEDCLRQIELFLRKKNVKCTPVNKTTIANMNRALELAEYASVIGDVPGAIRKFNKTCKEHADLETMDTFDGRILSETTEVDFKDAALLLAQVKDRFAQMEPCDLQYFSVLCEISDLVEYISDPDQNIAENIMLLQARRLSDFENEILRDFKVAQVLLKPFLGTCVSLEEISKILRTTDTHENLGRLKKTNDNLKHVKMLLALSDQSVSSIGDFVRLLNQTGRAVSSVSHPSSRQGDSLVIEYTSTLKNDKCLTLSHDAILTHRKRILSHITQDLSIEDKAQYNTFVKLLDNILEVHACRLKLRDRIITQEAEKSWLVAHGPDPIELTVRELKEHISQFDAMIALFLQDYPELHLLDRDQFYLLYSLWNQSQELQGFNVLPFLRTLLKNNLTCELIAQVQHNLPDSFDGFLDLVREHAETHDDKVEGTLAKVVSLPYPSDVFSQFFSVYSLLDRLPHFEETFFCTEHTSVDDIDLFNARRQFGRGRDFVFFVLHVNLLRSPVRDHLLVKEHEQRGNCAPTYFVFSSPRGKDVFTSLTEENLNWDSEHCFEAIQRASNDQKWISRCFAVHGIAQQGKTHWINQQMRMADSQLSIVRIPVCNDFSSETVIQKLREQFSAGRHEICVHLPVGSDCHWSEFHKFLFNLIYRGVVYSRIGGDMLSVTHAQLHLFVELPRIPPSRRDLINVPEDVARSDTDLLFRLLPCLKLKAEVKRISDADDYIFHMSEEARLIADFLHHWRQGSKSLMQLKESMCDHFDAHRDYDPASVLTDFFQAHQKILPFKRRYQHNFVVRLHSSCLQIIKIHEHCMHVMSLPENEQFSMTCQRRLDDPLFLSKLFRISVDEALHLSCEDNLQNLQPPDCLIFWSKVMEIPPSILCFNAGTNVESELHSYGLPNYSRQDFIESPALLRTTLQSIFHIEDVIPLISILSRMGYTLTCSFAVNLLMLHKAVQHGSPMLFLSGTGTGKTELLRLYSELINSNSAVCCDIVGKFVNEMLVNCTQQGDEHPISEPSKDQIALRDSAQWDFIARYTTRKEDDDPKNHDEIVTLITRLLDDSPLNQQKIIVQKIFSWARQLYDQYPLLSQSDTVKQVLGKDVQMLRPELASQFLGDVFCSRIRDAFHYILMHSGISFTEFSGRLHAAEQSSLRLEKALTGQPFRVVVFLDEANTTSMPGHLKEAFCDGCLQGRTLHPAICFTAACNPYEAEKYQDSTGDGCFVNRQDFLVSELPDSFQLFTVVVDHLSDEQEREFVYSRFVKRFGNKRTNLIVEAISISQHFMKNATEKEGMPSRLRNASIRDIRRFERLLQFFYHDPSVDTLTMNYDEKRHREIAKRLIKRTEDSDIFHFSLFLALYMCYNAKLRPPLRRTYNESVQQLMRDQGIPFKESLQSVWASVCSQFFAQFSGRLPRGVAQTNSLRENLFFCCICIETAIPLLINGPPGQSKTLSFTLASMFMNGNKFAQFFQLFRVVSKKNFQCSQATKSMEIRHLFQDAIQDQHSFESSGLFDQISTVFLDEAGLPDEMRHQLKVLHEFLDHSEIGVVLITNNILDAAKSNRCLFVMNVESSDEDLLKLAFGCLDVNEDQCSPEDRCIITGLCRGFRVMSQQHNFFHLRDFVYMNRTLRKYKSLQPGRILRALERHFSGLPAEEFSDLVKCFEQCISDELRALHGEPNFRFPQKRRTAIEILRESLADSLEDGEDPNLSSFRHVCVLDPTENEASIRLLFSQYVVDANAASIVDLSDFSEDSSEESLMRAISRVKSAMREGKLLIWLNGTRIFSNFYDIFNRHVTQTANKSYAYVSDGFRSSLCEVHPNFRSIIHLPLSQLPSTPLPFLNRFEKYILSFQDVIADKCMQSERFGKFRSIFTALEHECTRFMSRFPESFFFGSLERETLMSLIASLEIHQDSDTNDFTMTLPPIFGSLNPHTLIKSDLNALLRAAVRHLNFKLLEIAQPIEMYISKNHFSDDYLKEYFESQSHLLLAAFMRELLHAYHNTKHDKTFKKWILTTRSCGALRMLSSNHNMLRAWISEDTALLERDVQVVNLSTINSHSELFNCISGFFTQQVRTVLAVVCDMSVTSRKQINSTRLLIDSKMGKIADGVDLPLIVFVVHYPPEQMRFISSSCYSSIWINGWENRFFDSYDYNFRVDREQQEDDPYWNKSPSLRATDVFSVALGLQKSLPVVDLVREYDDVLIHQCERLISLPFSFRRLSDLHTARFYHVPLEMARKFFTGFLRGQGSQMKTWLFKRFASEFKSEVLLHIVNSAVKTISHGGTAVSLLDVIQSEISDHLASFLTYFVNTMISRYTFESIVLAFETENEPLIGLVEKFIGSVPLQSDITKDLTFLPTQTPFFWPVYEDIRRIYLECSSSSDAEAQLHDARIKFNKNAFLSTLLSDFPLEYVFVDILAVELDVRKSENHRSKAMHPALQAFLHWFYSTIQEDDCMGKYCSFKSKQQECAYVFHLLSQFCEEDEKFMVNFQNFSKSLNIVELRARIHMWILNHYKECWSMDTQKSISLVDTHLHHMRRFWRELNDREQILYHSFCVISSLHDSGHLHDNIQKEVGDLIFLHFENASESSIHFVESLKRMHKQLPPNLKENPLEHIVQHIALHTNSGDCDRMEILLSMSNDVEFVNVLQNHQLLFVALGRCLRNCTPIALKERITQSISDDWIPPLMREQIFEARFLLVDAYFEQTQGQLKSWHLHDLIRHMQSLSQRENEKHHVPTLCALRIEFVQRMAINFGELSKQGEYLEKLLSIFESDTKRNYRVFFLANMPPFDCIALLKNAEVCKQLKIEEEYCLSAEESEIDRGLWPFQLGGDSEMSLLYQQVRNYLCSGSADNFAKSLLRDVDTDSSLFAVRMFMLLVLYHDFFCQFQSCDLMLHLIESQQFRESFKLEEYHVVGYRFIAAGPSENPLSTRDDLHYLFSAEWLRQKHDMTMQRLIVSMMAFLFGLPPRRTHLHLRAFHPRELLKYYCPGSTTNLAHDCGFQGLHTATAGMVTSHTVYQNSIYHHSALNTLTFVAQSVYLLLFPNTDVEYLTDPGVHLFNAVREGAPASLNLFEMLHRYVFARASVFCRIFENDIISRAKKIDPLFFFTHVLFEIWTKICPTEHTNVVKVELYSSPDKSSYENFWRKFGFDRIGDSYEERFSAYCQQISAPSQIDAMKRICTAYPHAFASLTAHIEHFTLQVNRYVRDHPVETSFASYLLDPQNQEKINLLRHLPVLIALHRDLLSFFRMRFTREEIQSFTISQCFDRLSEKFPNETNALRARAQHVFSFWHEISNTLNLAECGPMAREGHEEELAIPTLDMDSMAMAFFSFDFSDSSSVDPQILSKLVGVIQRLIHIQFGFLSLNREPSQFFNPNFMPEYSPNLIAHYDDFFEDVQDVILTNSRGVLPDELKFGMESMGRQMCKFFLMSACRLDDYKDEELACTENQQNQQAPSQTFATNESLPIHVRDLLKCLQTLPGPFCVGDTLPKYFLQHFRTHSLPRHIILDIIRDLFSIARSIQEDVSRDDSAIYDQLATVEFSHYMEEHKVKIIARDEFDLYCQLPLKLLLPLSQELISIYLSPQQLFKLNSDLMIQLNVKHQKQYTREMDALCFSATEKQYSLREMLSSMRNIAEVLLHEDSQHLLSQSLNKPIIRVIDFQGIDEEFVHRMLPEYLLSKHLSVVLSTLYLGVGKLLFLLRADRVAPYSEFNDESFDIENAFDNRYFDEDDLLSDVFYDLSPDEVTELQETQCEISSSLQTLKKHQAGLDHQKNRLEESAERVSELSAQMMLHRQQMSFDLFLKWIQMM